MTLTAIAALLVILVLAIPVAAGLGWLGLVLNQFYSPLGMIVTLGGANEIGGYALAIASSWGCTVALVHRMHVRIDSVYTYLSPRKRAFLDILGLAAFIYFMALVTWYAYGVLAQSVVSNSHSISELETPLAWPQSLWVAGFLVFLFAATVFLSRAILAFAKGDLRRVSEILGARSAEEEIEVEKKSLGLATGTTDPARGTP